MELLRRLRQKTDLPVIFLTSKDDEIDELFGLKMGADDFIEEAVLAAPAGGARQGGAAPRGGPKDPTAVPKPTPSKIIERGKLAHGSRSSRLHLEGRAGDADRHRISDSAGAGPAPGIVKSRDALMDAAYDDQVYVDDRTIDSHIKRLRKKFKDVDDDFDGIETLYGVGYRFKEL